MSITVQYNPESSELLLAVNSNFDDSIAQEFTQAYVSNNASIKNYYIDLQHVDYIDSSIVGVLLEFVNFLKQKNVNGYMINMSKEILEEFRVLNLHKLFKPEFYPQKYCVIWACHGNE